jgi:hypothetical protein
MIVYTAEPGSPSAEKIRLLGSLAADRSAAEASSVDGLER